MHHLIILFLLPFFTAVSAFLLKPIASKHLKWIAFVLSLLPLAFLLYHHADWVGSSIQYPWFPALSIDFFLSVDALSLVFLYLTALIIPVSILSIRSRKLTHAPVFYGLTFLLQGLLFGFFTSRDLALFTFFWEAMLLPLFFIINLWGGQHKHRAALKFLVYMIAGSTLMIAGVIALYFISGTLTGTNTFNMHALMKLPAEMPHAPFIFAVFALAFAVKTPLFPFHAWLPEAYCQASTAGTILLAGILSKAGIYGFLRIGNEIFPEFMIAWSPLLIGLAIAGVFYGGLAAWRQNDFKRLLAYSSLSHVNFILAGVFVWSQTAQTGALIQSVNHGITIAALFLVAGWLEERLRGTSMHLGGGLAKWMPSLCWLTLFFVLSSIALPGTNNFIGEFFILFGIFGLHPFIAAALGLTVVLSVLYMLRLMQKMYFQAPTLKHSHYVDIGPKEFFIALPLIFLILWIGLYPNPLIKHIEPVFDNSALAQMENIK